MCNCIELTNDALKEKGLKLSLLFIMPHDNPGGMNAVIPVQTMKINPHDRQARPASFIPTYCPFCGEKMEAESAK
jgi:hypothetical protein